MRVLHTIDECRSHLRPLRGAGRAFGLVPTMGALHEGHLSLMRQARAECGIVAASVFVNPTQFGPNEDLDEYPRDLERDVQLAEGVGVDVVFAPAAGDMYSEGCCTSVVQSGALADRLEGACRPGHFPGVLTVVAKLFHIVEPDVAYFGRKDYQQSLVILSMVRDLDMPVRIVVCPTVREPDGLAMSSRNQYLDAAARRQAASLYRGLGAARQAFEQGEADAARLVAVATQVIRDAGPCEIDYVDIADAETLKPLDVVDRPAVASLAVHIAGTRLIDNIPLSP
jgi:pantoate--beta-alanine ligase